MATQTAVGLVSGTRLQPSVMITVWDDALGTLGYDTALAAAVGAAPPTIFNAALNDTDVTVADRSKSAITFEMNYGRRKLITLTRNFSQATRPKRLFDFVTPIGVYDTTGEVSSQYGYYQNRLNRNGSMSEYNATKPTIVDPLQEFMTLSYTSITAAINDAYIQRVAEMAEAGVFNISIFWGYPVATLQFIGFTANEQTDGAFQLNYSFGYKDFRTSISMGDGIVIPEMRGCDTLWPIEEEVFADGKVQPKTKAWVLGQAWDLDDFDDLNLPWQGYLSMRTGDTTGILTTLYTHDITGSDEVEIHWEGGYRLSANVSGVTATTVSFSSGSGDILPVAGTRLLADKV